MSALKKLISARIYCAHREQMLMNTITDYLEASRDRSVRAAQRYLEPDHNLLASKYAWSRISEQLRAKGLAK